MAEVMLTTSDNPFSPFTDFKSWRQWDEAQGYHTLAYLARVTRTSDELSIADQDLAIEYAIDEIIRENILGLYQKIENTSQLPDKTLETAGS